MTPEMRKLLREAGVVQVRNACPQTGKSSMTSCAHAQAEADRLNQRRPYSGPWVKAEPYQCRWCQLWHVGRPRRRARGGCASGHPKPQGKSA